MTTISRIYLLLLLCPTFFIGQGISGQVKDLETVVKNAIIYLKDSSEHHKILQYTETDDNGNFSFNNAPDHFYLEVRSMEHETVMKEYRFESGQKEIRIEITLTQKSLELHEVVVTQRPPIEKKKDTVIYNISKFRDGTEKVVEDVLKKLPGIKVDKDGQITYNGRQIKKLLFDGDDLFDQGYATGSKNIDAEMIESVEAYSNYSEYSQLKGITTSEEDVAVNIKLKQDRGDLSGNLKLGAGYRDIADTRANAMYFRNPFKIFAVGGYNNINQDFGSAQTAKLMEQSLVRIIPESTEQFSVDPRHGEVSKKAFTDVHALYRISRSTTAKLSGSHSSQRDFREYVNATTFSDTSASQIYTRERITRSPNISTASATLTSNLSKKQLLEYTADLNYETSSRSSTLDNNGSPGRSDTDSRQRLWQQELKYISRIRDSVALQISGRQLSGRTPQTYAVGLSDFSEDTYDLQQVTTEIDRFEGQASVAGTSHFFKWKLEAAHSHSQEKLESSLESNRIPGETNDLRYSQQRTTISGAAGYLRKTFSIQAELKAEQLHLGLKQADSANREISRFLINPTIRFGWLIREQSVLKASYSRSVKTPALTNLYGRNILTSYRLLTSGFPDIGLIPTDEATLRFSTGTLMNLPMIEARLNWNRTGKNYFPSRFISDQLNIISSRLLPEPANTYSSNLSFKHYFSPLKLTYEFGISYSDSYSRTSLNSLNLIDSRNQSGGLNLTIRNSSRSLIYLENVLSFSLSKGSLDGLPSNTYSTLEDKIRLVYKIKQSWRFATDAHFYYPDLSSGQTYCFVDARIEYNSSHKIDYALVGNNLLNYKTFDAVSVDEISRSVSSFNLMPAYVMASASFRF